MSIRKSIACMALMISTGYSSLMSPDEFEGRLKDAVNTTKYPFKNMQSKKPGLNESREYYRVVEGFVGHWFEHDKELLSLAIAAGKFGTNTEFMWTLYNMASMGALRFQERYERPYGISPVISRKNSCEIKPTEENQTNSRIAHNPVIGE